MKVAPVYLATRLLSPYWSAAVGPDSMISAPYPFTAFTLTDGVSLGMTMVAFKLSSLAT
jgi:hypothetical protein